MNQETPMELRIPMPVRACTDKQAAAGVRGGTVGQVMANLVKQNPPLRQHPYGEGGALRSCVTLYLYDEDVCNLERTQTVLSPGHMLAVPPAVTGEQAAEEGGL